jgi:D-methionine transport system substrate-binding protein
MLKKLKLLFILPNLIGLSLVGLSLIGLTGCGSQDKHTLKVGVISGPETELMEVAKDTAKSKYGLNVKIIEFTDFIQPNAALNDGSIDANMFQHQPYLDQQMKDRHYSLVAIGKTFVYPMGVYSSKFKTVQDLPMRATIGIPNDPTNEGRALLLLQKAGLITLKDTNDLSSTPADIASNPKKLRFKELDAAQLARSLQDMDAAVINTNYAIPAGLSPTKDAIFHEGSDSPYANIIVIRTDEQNDPRMQQLVSALQSEEVLKASKKIFNDQAIPAW